VLCLLSACNNTQKTNNEPEKPKQINKDALYGDLYTFYTVEPKDQFEKDQNALIEYCADKLLNPKRVPSGFFILVEKNGKGPQMKWNDEVTVDYRGYFLDDKEFDSSYKRGVPMTFRVGEMIPAWNEALMMLSKGSKLKLFVPSKLAYGERGFPGYISPNTPIIFEITVFE
jgi:FKBP-type peptidyl-prolyl cis-trans isomerase